LVVITGTSSGLGRKTAIALLRTGEYHVIGGVRDLDKMEAVAEVDGFPSADFTPMLCELNSFDSVKEFCDNVQDFCMDKPIDRLICNAGVYQPSLPYPKWSKDGHEQTMQINYLSHFLMIRYVVVVVYFVHVDVVLATDYFTHTTHLYYSYSKLLPSLMQSKDPRVTMVGSVTGNDNTVGGGGVYPIADLHELDGFEAGFTNPVAMADGYSFDGAKSYKDSKLCLMMLSNTLHAKYNKLTGISFSSIYPGCIAESPLFREKRTWFRQYFPIFMKFITGGFVGEEEAGQRLFQVAHDPRCTKSGVYWSWNGGPREGRGMEAVEKGGQISGGGGAGGGWDSIFENDQSAKVLDMDLAMNLFTYSTAITEADWPDMKQITSPCPTLQVIGGVSKYMIAKEEMKRIRADRPGFNEDGTPIKVSKFKKTQVVADKVVGTVVGNTVGRVFRFVGRRLLGRIPDTALTGSFDEEAAAIAAAKAAEVAVAEPVNGDIVMEHAAPTSAGEESMISHESDQEMLADEIAQQIFTEDKQTVEATGSFQ
jgi:protochlorophyllide reductase